MVESATAIGAAVNCVMQFRTAGLELFDCRVLKQWRPSAHSSLRHLESDAVLSRWSLPWLWRVPPSPSVPNVEKVVLEYP